MSKQKSDKVAGIANIRNTSQLLAAMKRFRKLANQTQADLGEASTLPQTTISKIEVGSIDPSLKTLFKILTALNLEIELKVRGK